MALGDLLIKVGIDGSNINKDLAKIRKKLDKSAARFSSIGANISMGISAPLGILGTQAITTAAEFQTLETGLQTLTGSVDKGTAAFERLKEFSAQTPFQLQDLVAANNTMMGFGLTAEDAFTSLNQLGDIAAVMGSDLNSMSLAFGQSAASGVAMTADINQFINQGVPMYKLLGEVTGKTTAQLNQMASKSQITFPLIQKALKKATSEGGMFFEGMKKGSQTLGGVLSTFKDKLALALGTLGEAIADTINFKDVVGKLGDAIGKATDFFAGLSDTTKKIIIGIVGTIAVLGPLMFAMGGLVNVLSSATSGLQLLNTMLFSSPYLMAAAGVAALVGGIIKLHRESTLASRVTDRLNKRFNQLVSKNVGPLNNKLNTLSKKLEKAKISGEGFAEVQKSLKSEFKDHIENSDKLGGSYDDLKEAIDKAGESVLEFGRRVAATELIKEIQKEINQLDNSKMEEALQLPDSIDQVSFIKAFDDLTGTVAEREQQFMRNLFGNENGNVNYQAAHALSRKHIKAIREIIQTEMSLNDQLEKRKELLTALGGPVEKKNQKEKDKATASTNKATEASKTYRDELQKIDRHLKDKLTHRHKALADAMQVVRGEMERVSEAGKKNIFGESVEDLRKLEDELFNQLKNLDFPSIPDSMDAEGFMQSLSDRLSQEELVFEPKTTTVQVKKGFKFDFRDVTEALDTLGLGGQIGSAFENLFNKLQEAGKNLGEGIKSGVMIGVAAIDLINQSFDLVMQAKQRKLDKAHELEMNRIDASTASEEVKQKRKAVAEKRYEKESQAIKKRMAQRDKARAIFEATINTAAAMTKVLGTPLMAVVAALGAAQVATIAATPIPMAKGGILSGPTNILAGEYMGARNNPEIIAPLDKLRNMINTDQNINLSGSFRLTGDDLLLAVEQANKTRQRQGGITLF